MSTNVIKLSKPALHAYTDGSYYRASWDNPEAGAGWGAVVLDQYGWNARYVGGTGNEHIESSKHAEYFGVLQTLRDIKTHEFSSAVHNHIVLHTDQIELPFFIYEAQKNPTLTYFTRDNTLNALVIEIAKLAKSMKAHVIYETDNHPVRIAAHHSAYSNIHHLAQAMGAKNRYEKQGYISVLGQPLVNDEAYEFLHRALPQELHFNPPDERRIRLLAPNWTPKTLERETRNDLMSKGPPLHVYVRSHILPADQNNEEVSGGWAGAVLAPEGTTYYIADYIRPENNHPLRAEFQTICDILETLNNCDDVKPGRTPVILHLSNPTIVGMLAQPDRFHSNDESLKKQFLEVRRLTKQLGANFVLDKVAEPERELDPDEFLPMEEVLQVARCMALQNRLERQGYIQPKDQNMLLENDAFGYIYEKLPDPLIDVVADILALRENGRTQK